MKQTVAGLALGLAVALAGGCEMHSFMDPSVTGRWERTPVVLPILERLDVIDEPSDEPPGLSQVMPEDLVDSPKEYVVGPGDLLTVTVFQLLIPGVESVQTRRVDELGMIRLPIVGGVKVVDRSPSQIETDIGDVLIRKGVLREPTVSVIVQEQRQNTFNVIGESTYSSTAIGTYAILGRDFRLLDAMALARGVPGQIKKLYVIRQLPAESPASGQPVPGKGPVEAPKTPEKTDPGNLIDALLPSADAGKEPGGMGAAAPAPLAGALEDGEAPAYVNVDGKWVKVEAGKGGAAGAKGGKEKEGEAAAQTVELPRPAQRVIEIPYDKLIEGDTRYNIIIRSKDTVRVPAPVIGNIYVGGAINRPGSYGLPGDKDLTLQQLVFAAGNFSPIAIPERVDLIRRIGKTQQATVRVNMRAIFQGTAPDIFLKPNDTINVGTSFMATPLAVIRNGFRASYGFGFVLDRNFDEEVFGPRIGNSN